MSPRFGSPLRPQLSHRGKESRSLARRRTGLATQLRVGRGAGTHVWCWRGQYICGPLREASCVRVDNACYARRLLVDSDRAVFALAPPRAQIVDWKSQPWVRAVCFAAGGVPGIAAPHHKDGCALRGVSTHMAGGSSRTQTQAQRDDNIKMRTQTGNTKGTASLRSSPPNATLINPTTCPQRTQAAWCETEALQVAQRTPPRESGVVGALQWPTRKARHQRCRLLRSMSRSRSKVITDSVRSRVGPQREGGAEQGNGRTH